MNVIILSLPIPEIYDKYERGNHQLFCEYLQSLIKIKGINDINIIKLKRDIIDRYNNKKIVEEILKLKPDVVCFSSYLWNIDRNIKIAKELKNSDIITITGGPDIQIDNDYIFKENNVFDYYVIGEGELTLLEILLNIKKNKTITKINYGKEIDFNEYLEEYFNITDQYTFDKLLYIEIERGCKFKCNYCAYGKSRESIKKIDLEIFKKALKNFWNNKNIEEIYLLSPTINHNKDFFKNIMKDLIYFKNKYNNNIKIFGELRPEFITKEDIILLKEGGFKSLEIGIQSFDSNVINTTGRKKIKFSFEELTKLLLQNDIELIIDFIIGLPQDNLSNILKTIELLDKNNLLQYCNFYRLQLLPGTILKKIFENRGFEYQKEPPYFVINTEKLLYNEMFELYIFLEKEKNFSYYEDFIIKNKEQFFIIKNEKDLNTFLNNNYYYHSGSLIFINNFDFDKIYEFFNYFFKKNSEVFHTCYIYSKNKIDKKKIDTLKNIFSLYKNYYDKYNEITNFLNEPLSKRITILVDYSVNLHYLHSLYSDYNIDFIIFDKSEIAYIKNIALDFDMNIFELKDDMLTLI